jgi:hypothetical protein
MRITWQSRKLSVTWLWSDEMDSCGSNTAKMVQDPHKCIDCSGEKRTGDPQLLRAITVLAQNIKMLSTFTIPS